MTGSPQHGDNPPGPRRRINVWQSSQNCEPIFSSPRAVTICPLRACLVHLGGSPTQYRHPRVEVSRELSSWGGGALLSVVPC